MYKIHAPELEPSVAWLNTARPLSLRELRGRLVILDFWTYCCVNCMHVVPVLRELERRHAADPLVVIGVHSAKFDAEAEPDRVADAIARYGIEHPVVVDRDMAIWEKFAIRSWPTLVFVRPDGTLAAVAPGEPDPELLEQFVVGQLEEARRAGTLLGPPIDAARVAASRPPTPLAFPGKVAVANDGRIALSDSAHHRVLVVSADGEVLATVGSGQRGFVDGPFGTAAMDDPQGVAWDGDALWICDTRNHAVRRADLVTRQLSTEAGTGRMGVGIYRGDAPARSVELRSPWDVLVDGETVFIAMAGSHQLWALDKSTGRIAPFAGSGRESLVDGAAMDAAFAQPSGLSASGRELLVADSETSSVRVVDLRERTVSTLVGEGLFDFGDVDGPLRLARLQHALDLAVARDSSVIVADTYNDRLRRIDRDNGRVTTFYRGSGATALREPGGIALDPAGGFVVADTGNHRLVRIGEDGSWGGEIALSAVPPPRDGDVTAATAPAGPARESRSWFDAAIEPSAGESLGEGAVLLSLTVAPPPGWKLAPESDVRLTLEVSRRSDLLDLERDAMQLGAATAAAVVFTVPVAVARLPSDEVASEVLCAVDAVLCSSGNGAACVPARGWFRLPVALRRRGDTALGFVLPLGTPPL